MTDPGGFLTEDKSVSQAIERPINEQATPGTFETMAEKVLAVQEIERIIRRLDVGIAEEQKAVHTLLSRLRTTRIAV